MCIAKYTQSGFDKYYNMIFLKKCPLLKVYNYQLIKLYQMQHGS